MSHLLIEHRISAVTILEQQTDGLLRFEAVVGAFDYVNANKRYYPFQVLWSAFEEMMQHLARHPGMVDHPGAFEPSSVSDVGIIWETFWTEGNAIVGRGRIVPTQKGKDLAAAIQAGVEIGFSTRGYGKSKEAQIDGNKVELIETYSFTPDGGVDAVINPSVRYARIRQYTKEDIEKMDDELRNVQEALAAAQAANAALTQELTSVKEALQRVEAQRKEAEARVVEQEATIAQLSERLAAYELEATLLALTSEHRFGATIRAEVKKLQEQGITVTLDNVAAFVTTFTTLVENAASAANIIGAAPRGVITSNEDAEKDDEYSLSPEQLEDLRKAGLL